MRQGTFSRKTRETHLDLSLDLDGNGVYEINTGVGFFNHMLETISRHSLINISLSGSGDIHVDYHHLVEDTGILLGHALIQLLGDKRGLKRFGWAILPLDEALVEVSIDISGRPFYVSNLSNYKGLIGNFDMELGDVFFQGFASMGYTLHILVQRGENRHHILEASCKAFAHALRQAIQIDQDHPSLLPTTKDYFGA
ncbi:imidazoleglycerol-phosphate dehydratase HisB [Thermospira aquatica]|uniref:Imidazoleglycerol-phosphate dehydratase n=1 Tax=Thermospira aquatica TaxID=2828656 RepID=A0AAX3BD08_9SPIR|nr:imidazoleglycerol-phosphate dehydratase HisB [Thermospira aquatica]URA09978.1 imidazoleglycerol-phosphate dehydratase HisB [Thermospira aquatica]